jgi:hypothetical protein
LDSTAAEWVAEIAAQIPEQRTIQRWPKIVADAAAEYARSIAPVGGAVSRDRHPGEFRDSIKSEDAPDHDGLPAARVVSDLRQASYIEYGTARTPEHATFAKTVAHFNNVQGVSMWVGSDEMLADLPQGRDLSEYPTLD